MTEAEKPRKAYIVREESEGHAVVVFATNGAEARRLGAGELNMDFGDVESCRRSPEFDAYADAGEVPPLVAIAHGWWFECGHCGRRVDSDGIDEDLNELAPVADGLWVYCSEAHRMADWAERRVTLARELASIEACATRFHGWPISNLRGVRHYQIGGRETVEACDFDFPGRAGMPARWDIGDGQVWVSQCDVPAWEALRAQFEPKADGPAP